MENAMWREFFVQAIRRLGAGDLLLSETPSWCSWTTFERLKIDAGYWVAGLPRLEDVGDEWIADGGVWGQPFRYSSIAHLIIPKEFYWESNERGFTCGSRAQDIEGLAESLSSKAIPFRVTDLVLEIKVY